MEASFARSILVDAPMAVVAIDHAGLIRSSNATADAFFGRKLSLGTPINVAALIPGLDIADLTSSAGLESFNARSRAGGDGVHMPAHRVDGPLAFVDIQAARFSASDEDFLTLFIQDVTAIVAAENAE